MAVGIRMVSIGKLVGGGEIDGLAGRDYKLMESLDRLINEYEIDGN